MPAPSKVIKAQHSAVGSPFLVATSGHVPALSENGLSTTPPTREAAEASTAMVVAARQEAQQMIYEASKQVLALEQDGYRSGLEQGRQAGLAERSAEVARLRALVEGVVLERQHLIRTAEDEVVALALAVARAILHRELATDTASVLPIVRAALEDIDRATMATIYVHPEDVDLVRSVLDHEATLHGTPSHRVVPVRDVTRGGCRVEAAGAMIDATIAATLARVAATFSQVPTSDLLVEEVHDDG